MTVLVCCLEWTGPGCVGVWVVHMGDIQGPDSRFSARPNLPGWREGRAIALLCQSMSGRARWASP